MNKIFLHKCTWLLVFFLNLHLLLAQNQDRKFVDASVEKETLKVQTNDGVYYFKFYTPNVIETSFVPNTEKYNPASHAIVQEVEAVETAFAKEMNR